MSHAFSNWGLDVAIALHNLEAAIAMRRCASGLLTGLLFVLPSSERLLFSPPSWVSSGPVQRPWSGDQVED
jgi:hypothetical protein